jgi:hypothetical protein
MNQQRISFWRRSLVAVAMAAFVPAAQALPFITHQADLCLGFRKVGAFKENNEAVANIGPATNLVNLIAGATITVTNVSATQLSPDTFTSLNDLSFSAFGSVFNSALPGYPMNTFWVSMPRSNVNMQSAPPDRSDQDSQGGMITTIDSILSGAVAISGRISPNQDNTATFVREPASNFTISQGQNLGAYIASTVDPDLGTFQDNWPVNAENASDDTFSSAIRSDLYEVRPTGFVDPHTGQMSGSAYFVGYFQFNPSGSITFTRASVSVSPPAPVLQITRSGTASTISFQSTNPATYTLYYTNATGLTTPTTNWPAKAGTITGDNTIKSFIDNTSDDNRFYRVKAQ